jgi:hypothetical protein
MSHHRKITHKSFFYLKYPPPAKSIINVSRYVNATLRLKVLTLLIGQGDGIMRTLTMDEVGFVSGGGRPWNPYTDFKAPEQSEAYQEYEQLINMALQAAGLDYYGNPIDSGSSSGGNSSIGSTYSPPSSGSNVGVTVGNNGVQVQGTTTLGSGTVTGTITVPYDPGPPGVRVEFKFPF